MNNSSKLFEFLYKDQTLKLRVDSFISANTDQYSRSYIKKLIIDGFLSINSQSINDPSFKLSNGDKIKLFIPEIKIDKPEPQDIPIDIVYEDEYLLVINKTAGMVVHPAPGNFENTLVNALLYHCKNSLSGIGGVLRPGIVHRLDKDTSGLMLVAKDDYSHRYLSKAISLKKIDRIYTTFVWGIPKRNEDTINLHIGRHPKDRKKMSVVKEKGRLAITNFKLIKKYDIASEIECSLKTGRTHQIRVHMSHIGLPIIGDQLYSKKIKVSRSFPDLLRKFNRQALHSKSIKFVHPISKKILYFNSILPEDMRILVNELENFT